jgi:hypothetical protein
MSFDIQAKILILKIKKIKIKEKNVIYIIIKAMTIVIIMMAIPNITNPTVIGSKRPNSILPKIAKIIIKMPIIIKIPINILSNVI